MMELKIWFEGVQIWPNAIEEFLNSSHNDFSIEDILTKITLPTDTQLAHTGDIIAVNPPVPINTTTPAPTTVAATAPTTVPATTPAAIPTRAPATVAAIFR
jgi:hypothetical protein